MKSSLLTAVIIATNEESDLPGCLASLKPLGCPVLLVDGGSQDRTLEIALGAGATVFKRAFDDFTRQRRFALNQAHTPWILQIDADERVSPNLAIEIPQVIADGNKDAYRIPFHVRFMGRTMRFSGLGSQEVLRLYRKEAAAYTPGRSVHESLDINPSRTGSLRHFIDHRPYENLTEYLKKCDAYTRLAAQDFLSTGGSLGTRDRLIPAWEFFRCYFLFAGFLDGLPGLVWAALSAYHKSERLRKIKELIAASRVVMPAKAGIQNKETGYRPPPV